MIVAHKTYHNFTVLFHVAVYCIWFWALERIWWKPSFVWREEMLFGDLPQMSQWQMCRLPKGYSGWCYIFCCKSNKCDHPVPVSWYQYSVRAIILYDVYVVSPCFTIVKQWMKQWMKYTTYRILQFPRSWCCRWFSELLVETGRFTNWRSTEA